MFYDEETRRGDPYILKMASHFPHYMTHTLDTSRVSLLSMQYGVMAKLTFSVSVPVS